jgi:peptidoglycan hydrolase-like protein with peptidoglycan-binding domain
MKKINLFILLFLCFGISGVAVASTPLTKNLYKGIQDEEVRSLQKFLNTSSDTIVSDTGLGSLGNETDYFGDKTKNAVARFQNKYASEILTPIGLYAGTGYVGSITRQKINSLLGVTPSTFVTNNSNSVSVSTSAKDKIKAIVMPVLNRIFGVSSSSTTTATTSVASNTTSGVPKITKITPEVLMDGGVMTIYGSGFTQNNRVFISIEPPDKYVNIKSTKDGTNISLTVNTVLGEKFIGGLRKSFEKMPSNIKDIAMQQLLEGFRKDNGQSETGEKSILVPAFVNIENENGKSEFATTTINIFKEL